MNAHQIFDTELNGGAEIDYSLADEGHCSKAPLETMPGWQRRKRQEAMQMLVKCCALWEEADRIGLTAVREKLEPVITHAHDCFVRMQEIERELTTPKRKR